MGEHSFVEITRFMDAPNRVEQCLGCDAVIVTPPPCATGEQLARARRLALMLRAELKEAS